MKKNLTNSEDNRRDWHGEIPRKTYGTGGLIDQPDLPARRLIGGKLVPWPAMTNGDFGTIPPTPCSLMLGCR